MKSRLRSIPVQTAPPAVQPPRLVCDFVERAGLSASPGAALRLSQRAEMRFNPADSWRPLSAEQWMAIGQPAFVWFAQGRIGSPLSTRVVDAYLGGRGFLEARLLGSLPVARFGGPEMARAELMRYLAELAWAPEAMIYNRSLRWRELEGNTIEVSAESAGGTARVRLFFEDGDLVRAEADDRPRIEGRSTVPRRWIGRFSDYRILNGRRIPLRAEVGWVLDDGFFAAWRGEISAVELPR